MGCGRPHSQRAVAPPRNDRPARLPSTGQAAAEAIRFVIEILPESVRGSCSIEVDEFRYAREAIRDLYDREDYPLQRVK